LNPKRTVESVVKRMRAEPSTQAQTSENSEHDRRDNHRQVGN